MSEYENHFEKISFVEISTKEDIRKLIDLIVLRSNEVDDYEKELYENGS